MPLGAEVSGDRVFALLDEFVHDGDHHGIVELDALIHLFLLHRGLQQADGAQAHAVFGAHGGFHVFGDLCFEAHGAFLKGKKIRKKKPAEASLASFFGAEAA